MLVDAPPGSAPVNLDPTIARVVITSNQFPAPPRAPLTAAPRMPPGIGNHSRHQINECILAADFQRHVFPYVIVDQG
jgi:hypothetical protein